MHHGSNAGSIDENHGGILFIWDRLFGTFEPETEPVRYGLTTPVGAFHPIEIQIHEFADLAYDLIRARILREAWRALTWMPKPGMGAGGPLRPVRER